MNARHLSSIRHRARQRGAVLIVALLVLVATILAAIALVRSVDVANLISGNLAFRQTGVQAADSGVEMGRKWLMSVPVDTLNTANPAAGYYATQPFDLSKFVWTPGTTSFKLPTVDAAGNTVEYVVHRMCETDGTPNPPNRCFTAKASTAGGNSNRIREPDDLPCIDADGNDLCASSVNPFYRITVRVSGPRNTVTYVQAVIY